MFLELIESGDKPISGVIGSGEPVGPGTARKGARSEEKRTIIYWRNTAMKTWTKPAVREQEVGLEVTSYLPAEIDVI